MPSRLFEAKRRYAKRRKDKRTPFEKTKKRHAKRINNAMRKKRRKHETRPRKEEISALKDEKTQFETENFVVFSRGIFSFFRMASFRLALLRLFAWRLFVVTFGVFYATKRRHAKRRKNSKQQRQTNHLCQFVFRLFAAKRRHAKKRNVIIHRPYHMKFAPRSC